MKKLVTLFAVSRIQFFLFAYLASQLIPLREGYLGKESDKTLPYLAWVWANFDGRHFLAIANGGYSNYDFAFFPLYPLVTNLTGNIFQISALYGGILISLTALIISLFVLHKIASLDFPKKVADLAVLALIFFPLAFFYHSVYSDALFLLFSVSSFYFARKKSWVYAGLLGALACLTRLSGIALLPALALEWYFQNRDLVAVSLKKKTYSQLTAKFLPTGGAALVLTGLGLLLYMAYLKFGFGDWLLFQKSMVAWQQNNFIFPAQVVVRYLKIFTQVDRSLLVYWIAVLEFVSLFVYLGLTVYVFKKVRASYGVFMLALLLMVPATGTFAGTPRYLLHLFPGFIGIALIMSRNKVFQYILWLVFLILGFFLAALFTRGYFVS